MNEQRNFPSGSITYYDPGPRPLPNNIDAEAMLIGTVFTEPELLDEVREIVAPGDFYSAANAAIYNACCRLADTAMRPDPISLKNWFESTEGLDAIGGTTYLAQIAGLIALPSYATTYARTVKDAAIRRALIQAGQEMVARAYDYDRDDDGEGQIELAEAELYELAETEAVDTGLVAPSDAFDRATRQIEAAYQSGGALIGVTTGLTDLDVMTGGLQAEDLIVVAGRPSMGKTGLALTMALAAAAHGTVAFFSLEMSVEQIETRIISGMTAISGFDLRTGRINSDDFTKVMGLQPTRLGLPLWVDDSASLTVSSLRTRARRLKRQHGLALIVVDFLQLMAPAPGARAEGRVQEVSAITRGLKGLAKELKVPVLALSQLNRKLEERSDKRPTLGDLRESGEIEQSADIVIAVYREEAYLQNEEPDETNFKKHTGWLADMEECRGLADLLLLKQRNGPVGTVTVQFDAPTAGFADLSKAEATAEERDHLI